MTRLELQAWRNFSRQTDIQLGGRAFFIGPNASGKSNILDALRFLRDVAGEGLQGAVAVRGGMSEIRSLHTRRRLPWRPVRIRFLEQIAATNKRSRESRLKSIQEALRAAVPQLE